MKPPVSLVDRSSWFRKSLADAAFYILPVLMQLSASVLYSSLTFPSAANPSMHYGGLRGERNTQRRNPFGPTARGFLPASLTPTHGDHDFDDLNAAMGGSCVGCPFVMKPDAAIRAGACGSRSMKWSFGSTLTASQKAQFWCCQTSYPLTVRQVSSTSAIPVRSVVLSCRWPRATRLL